MANPDQSIGSLIERARDATAALVERHDAFGEIVRRFQDLAFACASARLRDPALAEDAAQDAFLIAWERLDQLREPKAFPGWIRRLVLTQCYRRLRVTRLQVLPEEEAQRLAAPTDRMVNADATGDEAVLRLALSGLSPSDRLVLILFYGAERSQAEIADWLGVPITTISRRLAHAKRRLRERAIAALSRGLRAERRVAGDAFSVELTTRLRRVQSDDAAGIGTLWTRLGLGRAPAIASTLPSCAYLVEDPASRMPIAYAAAVQTIFRPMYDLQLAFGEGALRRHAGDVLLIQVLQDLVASDAIVLQHRTSARHAAVVEFLAARKFQIVERAQDWRLGPAAAASLAAVPSRDYELRALETVSQDPVLFDATLALVTDEIARTPWGPAVLPLHPDTLRRFLRSQRDGVVAIADSMLSGLLTSSADDVVPDAARINLVLIRASERRQGLATLLLVQLLAKLQATAARLVAPTAPDLTAWLTRRGFVQVADTLLLERVLRPTVQLAPERLDEYVGHYFVDAMPEFPIVIERHGDALVSKARDMRDLLLAASETEFFTTHHYGRGRFERDHTGRVARLVYTEGSREVIAIRQ